jgi:death on curing protein
VRGRPYLDGNKRAGLVVLVAFLGLGGIVLMATDAEAVDVILAVAAGTLSEDDLATWVRAHASARTG